MKGKMKKIIIAAVIVGLVVLFTSCNQQSCPAYSYNDTEQTEQA
jgi:PBP1b-binding outer membrane lipoprotein LpoB